MLVCHATLHLCLSRVMRAVVGMRLGLERVGSDVGHMQAMWCCCVLLMVGCSCACMCWRGSLAGNNLGREGGAAIGAGLRHVPSLTTLKYVSRDEGMVWVVMRACAYVGGWRLVEVGV
jgi:hypothetical protein